MEPFSQAYQDAAEELKHRIMALIPDHPEILEMDEARDLHRVPGFRCDDIGPSCAMADEALSEAKAEYEFIRPS